MWEISVSGHVVSKDLIHWHSLDHAIVLSEWYVIKGCWSGSATLLPGDKHVILYTRWANSSQQLQNTILQEAATEHIIFH